MYNELRWNKFIEDLRNYVQEHRHCPNKHYALYNAQKYYRKKMKRGGLSEDKSTALQENLDMWLLGPSDPANSDHKI